MNHQAVAPTFCDGDCVSPVGGVRLLRPPTGVAPCECDDLVAPAQTPLGQRTVRARIRQIAMTQSGRVRGRKVFSARRTDLKRLGARTPVGESSTTYCSPGHVQHLPVGAIKIDRSFVGQQAIHWDGADGASSILATVAMAKALCPRTIAQGAKVRARGHSLGEQGCGLRQDIGRTMPAEECALLASSFGRASTCAGAGRVDRSERAGTRSKL